MNAQSIEQDSHAFFASIVEGYRRSKVMFTAVTLGVFNTLGEGTVSATALAQKLGCDERTTRILMRALVAIGVCSYEGDDNFANTPLALRTLVASSPDYVGHNLAFQDLAWPLWSDLSDVVKNGRPTRDLMGLLSAQDAAFTENYIRGMLSVARPAAKALAHKLREFAPKKILDVGAGPGAYAMALLEVLPDAHAVLLDLPRTLEVTRTTVNPAYAERTQLKAANYLSDDFGSGYDLVLMSHITHDESPAANQRLFRQARAALNPGGRLVVHDFLVDESGCQPPFSALFAVHMAVYTEAGNTYSLREYSAWMEAAGLTHVTHTQIGSKTMANPSHLIVGTNAPT